MRTLLLLVGLAQAGGAGTVQDTIASGGALQAAYIRIILERSYAMVVAAYRVDRSGEPLAFNAVRMPGQIVLIDGAFGPGFELEPRQLVDQRQLVAPAGATGVVYIRIRYKVEGDYSRIPIFVPDAAFVPDQSTVHLMVIGAPEASILDDAFPRFERQADGSLIAAPAELPSAVLLPSTRETPPMTRIALCTAVLLLVGGGAYWAGRKLRSRRRPSRLNAS